MMSAFVLPVQGSGVALPTPKGSGRPLERRRASFESVDRFGIADLQRASLAAAMLAGVAGTLSKVHHQQRRRPGTASRRSPCWRSSTRCVKGGGDAANLNSYDIFMLSIEGVICQNGAPVPGAAEALGSIRDSGKKAIFFSDDDTQTRAQLAGTLQGLLNIPVAPDEVVTSTSVVASILADSLEEGSKVYTVGEPALMDELKIAGLFPVSSPYESHITPADFARLAGDSFDPNIRAVCVGYDSHFTYTKMAAASLYVRRGCRFCCTSPAKYVSIGTSQMPWTGCVCEAVESASDTRAEILGAPSQPFMDCILNQFQLDKSRILLVGTQLDAGVALGEKCGVDVCCIASHGEATTQQKSRFACTSLKALVDEKLQESQAE